MKGWISGIGWHTASGCGAGRSNRELPLLQGEVTIPKGKDIFSEPDKRFGRLDPFSKIGLAAAAACLRDGGREQWSEARPMGIVAASVYGCLATDMAYLESMLPDGGKFASPNLFAYTLANSFLGEIALRFGMGGNTLVINRHDDEHLAALHFGLEELALSEQSAVMAGVCDLPVPGFGRCGDISGAVFLLLEREEQEQSYGCLELVDGVLFFAQQQVTDLQQLLRLCLESC